MLDMKVPTKKRIFVQSYFAAGASAFSSSNVLRDGSSIVFTFFYTNSYNRVFKNAKYERGAFERHHRDM